MASDSESDFQDEFEEEHNEDSGAESDEFVPALKKRKTDPTKTTEAATTKKSVSKRSAVTQKTTVTLDESDDDNDNEVLKKTPVKKAAPAKKTTTPTKKAAPTKKVNESLDGFFTKSVPSSGSSLAETTANNEDTAMGEASTPTLAPKTTSKPKSKTIEETYKKKSQLEHILIRPDTYIGSIEAEEQEMWVFDSETENIVKKKIKYVPGLYKIVDEILVNAADNKVNDPTMNRIKVNIDPSNNTISIWNNGKGIPITEHKDEKCYVPEMIFGHLLTSSNYDDDEEKVTGGRNGYGAKLANIFSTTFIVETADKERKLRYKQEFKNNMSIVGKPKITSNSKGEEYTRITFSPDLEKFGMTELDADFESLIKRRVYDLAGCVNGVDVFLNDVKIPVKSFKKYCELYTQTMEFKNAEGKKPIVFDPKNNERWEVAFGVSDGQFNQISFVNSICTSKGGAHVTYIADLIVKAIMPEVQKKSNNKDIKPFQVKNHMSLFINCQIVKPAFDSQTKENMTLQVKKFGSSYKLDDKFISAISKSGIIDNIVRWVKFKESEQMVKADSGKMVRRLNIPKLEDATLAGVRPHNKDCTLILTEGDSAKGLVLSGLSVVGRDKFGVFPLRGKLLNVRDATNKQIMDNNEITNIKAILGLKHGETYTSVEKLRYGKLMLMTDQDHDGSHIKGLLINFIDSMFPSLLDIPGFLLEFITPIIKCTHKKSGRQVTFFTIPEYQAWALENNTNKEWKPKYFKGLGTSDKKDARKYFSDLPTHKKEFAVADNDERQLIDMAFNKKRATDRKNWLATYEPGIFIDHNVNKIQISDFVNRELMLFSMADNIRSIPSVVDGFKPVQRKVFFGSAKRSGNSEVKVAQLATYVAGLTQYHHGEGSVATTIVNMAQDYVGSNNINLLFPAGQFGHRHDGGKSASSPRYLFTKLEKIARTIYHPHDDDLLKYLIEENEPIEPEWYLPIIPMVLVNGASGIGTGWSTDIPNYNPRDLTENILRLMNDEDLVPMQPWFRGFKGVIEPSDPGKYTSKGIAEVNESGHIKITELPVRLWTDTFKEKDLDKMRDSKESKSTISIIDYVNNSTDVAVELTVELDEENLVKAEDADILKAFKLTKDISTSNLVCFDKDGKIRKYESPEEILKEFYDLRLEYYVKRKENLVYILKDEYERFDNKAKFIQLVIDKKLIYINRKEEDVIADMKSHGLKQIYPRKKKNVLVVNDEIELEGEGSGYDYLLTISVRGFTAQKVAELLKDKNKKFEELEEIQSTPPKTLWRRDLTNLMKEWDELLVQDELLASQGKPLAVKQIKKRKRVMKPKVPKAEGTSTVDVKTEA